MRLFDGETLRDWIRRSDSLSDRFLWGRADAVSLADLVDAPTICSAGALLGRSVLVLTEHPLSAARALVELDGVARQLIICPPGLRDEQLEWLAKARSFDAAVVDHERPLVAQAGVVARIEPGSGTVAHRPTTRFNTDWVMF